VDYRFGEAERAYIARTIARDSYKRAMDACPDIKAWAASVAAMRAAKSWQQALGVPPFEDSASLRS
jgi:hypothetical protein